MGIIIIQVRRTLYIQTQKICMLNSWINNGNSDEISQIDVQLIE